MANKELISRLYDIKNWKCNGDPEMHETISAAIEALESQECQAIIAGSYLLEGEDNVPNTNVGDTISRQAAIDEIEYELEMINSALDSITLDFNARERLRQRRGEAREILNSIQQLPSAQLDIKQAAKLLSDFIESCPGGDSYLITPDGEELRTDWGYVTEGIQLIHDWAERRSDG